MRGNVLLTWTPAWLLLVVLLVVGIPTSGRYRVGARSTERAIESAVRVERGAAAPRVAPPRRSEVGHRAASPNGAAVLLMLLARAARHGGLSR